jgi:prevent-host-death family protein
MKINIIGLKELRTNMNDYIAQVQKGKSYIVVRKSKPVFVISSPDDDEAGWETVVDFTKIKKGGVPIEEVLSALRACKN